MRMQDEQGSWRDMCDICGDEVEACVLTMVGGKVAQVTCYECRSEEDEKSAPYLPGQV